MVSILTPEKAVGDRPQGITFENILIFAATVSNIEVPYKDNIQKEDQIRLKTLKDFKFGQNPSYASYSSEYYQSQEPFVCHSKYKYGHFNDNMTLIFSEFEKERVRKEFIPFAANRREFLSLKQKEKAEVKKNVILHEFDHVPQINGNSQRKMGIEEMVNGNVAIYDHLLKKGEDYKRKSKHI